MALPSTWLETLIILVSAELVLLQVLQRSESLLYNDKITMLKTTSMTVTVVIKTRNKFLNMTGYFQPNPSNSKTVYACDARNWTVY